MAISSKPGTGSELRSAGADRARRFAEPAHGTGEQSAARRGDRYGAAIALARMRR